jgi:PadR family transcriptional regulator
MQELAITPRLAKLLKVFLEDPSRPWYGYELMKATGLQSGSLYPALIALEKHGWLAAGKEDIDPRVAGRPARRSYTITAAAAVAARTRLAALSEAFRPPVPARPALGGYTT